MSIITATVIFVINFIYFVHLPSTFRETAGLNLVRSQECCNGVGLMRGYGSREPAMGNFYNFSIKLMHFYRLIWA